MGKVVAVCTRCDHQETLDIIADHNERIQAMVRRARQPRKPCRACGDVNVDIEVYDCLGRVEARQ